MSLGDASAGEKMGARVRRAPAQTPEERAARVAQNKIEQAEIVLRNEEAALEARQRRVDAARAALEEAKAGS